MDTNYSEPEAELRHLILLKCNTGKYEFDLGEVKGSSFSLSDETEELQNAGIICRISGNRYRITCDIETLRAYLTDRGEKSAPVCGGGEISVAELLGSVWTLKPQRVAEKTEPLSNRFESYFHRRKFFDFDDEEDKERKNNQATGFDAVSLDDDDDDDDDDEELKPLRETVKCVRGDFSNSVFISKCDRGLIITVAGLKYRNGEEARFLMYCKGEKIFVSDMCSVYNEVGDEEMPEVKAVAADTEIQLDEARNELFLEITKKDTFAGIMTVFSFVNGQI